MSDRIAATFAACRSENRAALVTFITAGDPDFDTGAAILAALPAAGADIIELGVPFTDPMADGPAIQAGGLRALKTGQTLARTLELAATFRQSNTTTPIILMGYFNPIYVYGVERFLKDAKDAGVDGLIVVDLPPEEDDELCLPALQAGLHFIRLATPTTDEKRLPAVLANSSGFVYYVSVNGITGSSIANFDALDAAVSRIQRHTNLPVVVGFGVKTEDDARTISRSADGVVVGSALVEEVRKSLDANGYATAQTVDAVIKRVEELARGVRTARPAAAE